MITSFGAYNLDMFRVWTDELPAGMTQADVLKELEHLPEAPALTLAMAGSS